MARLLAFFAALVALAPVAHAATDAGVPPTEVGAKELTLETGEVLQNPGERELHEALLSLDGRDRKFAILSLIAEPQTYLQVYLDADQRADVILEYQDGSIERHFQAVSPVLALEEVVPIFERYRRDDPTWQRCCEWQRVDPAEFQGAEEPAN